MGNVRKWFASAALAGLLVAGAGSPSAARGRPAAKSDRAKAESFYQAGVEQYAYGRFPQALASFREALRLDPRDRDARLGANRVRAEMLMTAAERTAPAARALPLEDDSMLADLERFLFFEKTLGEASDREGRLRAMEGRISQLLVEKRIARSRRRRFAKDAELHALSRRLA